ncbi:metallophosphoesterase [Alkalicoccobacillus murimartini]|uniref:MPP superfamily phosphohydrolase n=1 Tax=Alkalicoccobacillus murimartini TaxID=171685 RepID=A0ABT9YKS8_9BACI|nr:metallophosphoesterase [Alkalicoccobacillus murimartini]MDQ0208477.1 putative MPP superfamily phosphohydrolase [Alkalicoccobacillus murimartini]
MKRNQLTRSRISLMIFLSLFVLVCQSSVNHVEASSTPDTIVWMTDTQYYSKEYPDIFMKMTDWIKENHASYQIKYMIHTGDIVDQYADKEQWKVAHKALKKLDRSPIPYGVLAGNHDVGHSKVDYKPFTHYFGKKRFKHQKEYGESYQDNRNHYDLISAGGRDFLMLYLGWGITDEDLHWAKAVLKKYPDKLVFLNVHDYLKADGARSKQGNHLFKELVAKHSSIYAVLCGHYHGAAKKIDLIDDNNDGKPDRTVYQLLADYQSAPSGGQGFMRLLSLHSGSEEVTVSTYSPYLDQFNYYSQQTDPGKDRFTIKLPLQINKELSGHP